MTKETMLKLIAEKGYVVSYAAQLNFSTYDIVTSIPQKVTFASLAIAVIGLIWPNINNYWITIPLLLISIACIYTERYAKNIDRYGNRGKENTKQWNDLKILYNKVKDASDEEGFEEEYKKLEEIGNAFNNSSEYDQIVFANWLAHYKLFFEKDYHWMDEQLNFGFFKHKIPTSLIAAFVVAVILCIVTMCLNCPAIIFVFNRLLNFCEC